MPRLDAVLSPLCVAVDVTATTKEAAITALVDLLFNAGKIHERDKLLQAVLEREALAPTSIGEGCAIPHAKTDLVSEPTLAALRLANPIDFGDPEGTPASLVFLIVSARDQASGHLRLLSKLARMLSGGDLRSALLSARGSAAFADLLFAADPPPASCA
jgi:fructose-specific phosphotransferase system IIA component